MTDTRVELRKGFDHVILTMSHERIPLPYVLKDDDGNVTGMEMREGDSYRISGTGLSATAHGFVAGDTREFSDRDAEAIRARANGWYASLRRQGFERIN